MAQVTERDSELPPDARHMGGRRVEDQLVGWRLGQLELSVQHLEEQVVKLRDDLVTRVGLETHATQQTDIALRVAVWIVAVGQLATTVLLLVTR